MASQPIRLTTPEEYLTWERQQERKHEYYNGEIIAIAGASFVHGLIVGNLLRALGEKLKGTNCREFVADLRLAVGSELMCYPDIIVACQPYEFLPRTTDTLNNPTFLIEVLSPSTRGTDRSFKLPRYRVMPSLSGYLFIEQDRISAEYGYRRSGEEWQVKTFTDSSDRIDLTPLPLVLNVSEIYTDVEFPS